MFLKRISIRKNGKPHTYWALVRSVRTARGPRHHVVSYLGELQPGEKAGWAQLAGMPRRPRFVQLRLFDDALRVDPASTDPVPEKVEVFVRRARVQRTRDFGDVYLGLLLWQTLGLDQLLDRRIERGGARVPWSLMAAVLTLARFCEPSSELHIADTWYLRTALDEILGIPDDRINTQRLYRTHDMILPHKEAIETHLKERFATLFDTGYDLLLYDVTSTYFEGQALRNPQARRGYSRDHRPDCKQVCIGLVVTPQGLPLAYDVFEGNRHDSTTLRDIVETMEQRHGRADRIWVLDRGMVSEENLGFLNECGGRYIVGTPKSMLRAFEKELLEKDWTEVEPGVEVRLCPGPTGKETFIVCRSHARQDKERAIHDRFEKRIEDDLTRLAARLQSLRKRPDRSQVERQIGRTLGRHARAAGLFDVTVGEIERHGVKGHLQVTWNKKETWREWARLSEGCYVLRTNLMDWSAADLWKSYVQLTQAESAFRTQKSELHLRPIWHHRQDRVQSHILFSFLAYALWKTLEQWMQRSGLGNGPGTVIEEFHRLKSTDVVRPTAAGRDVRLRCITTPDPAPRILLERLGVALPTRLGEPRWHVEDTECSQ